MMDTRTKVEVGIAVAAFVAAIGIMGWLAFETSRAQPSPLTTTLFAILLFLLSVAGSWYFGVLSTRINARDQFKPFARSELRRVIEIGRGIARAISNINSEVEDTPDADNVLETKEFLRGLRRQLIEQTGHIDSAIEGWGEIIPDYVDELRKRDEATLLRIEERRAAAAMSSDWGRVLHDEIQALKAGLSNPLAVEAGSSVTPGQEAKALMEKGNYAAAVDVYRRRIAENPNVHTHYVGLAQAQDSLGEKRAAVESLRNAERLNQNDGAVYRLVKSSRFDEESSPLRFLRRALAEVESHLSQDLGRLLERSMPGARDSVYGNGGGEVSTVQAR